MGLHSPRTEMAGGGQEKERTWKPHKATTAQRSAASSFVQRSSSGSSLARLIYYDGVKLSSDQVASLRQEIISTLGSIDEAHIVRPSLAPPQNIDFSADISLNDILSVGIFSCKYSVLLQELLCEENLRFWKEAVSYRNMFSLRSDQARMDNAKEIWTSFFADESETEVNVSFENKESVRGAIESGGIGANLFKGCENEIFHLMNRDSRPKFLTSDHFRAAKELYLDLKGTGQARPPDLVKMSKADWDGVFATGEKVQYSAGETFIQPNVQCEHLYQLVSGTVAYQAISNSGVRRINDVGFVFGDVNGLLSEGCKFVKASAETAVHLKRVKWSFLTDCLLVNSELGLKFYRWLAQKLGKKYLNLLQYSEEDAAAEAAIEGVTNDVSTIINGKAESFSKRFNLPEDEIVLMVTECSQTKGPVKINGHLFISNEHIAFDAKVGKMISVSKRCHAIKDIRKMDRHGHELILKVAVPWEVDDGLGNMSIANSESKVKFVFSKKNTRGMAEAWALIDNLCLMRVKSKMEPLRLVQKGTAEISQCLQDMLDMRSIVLKPGDTVISEGETNVLVCYLSYGKLQEEKRLPKSGLAIRISEVGAGTFFGSATSITQREASASFVAMEESKVHFVCLQDVNDRFAKSPGEIVAFYKLMCTDLSNLVVRLRSQGLMASS